MKLNLRQVTDSLGNRAYNPVEFKFPENAALPNHVALICDGNRRWARARSLPVAEGHRKGGEAIREIARACRDFGIQTFTIWVFSTENWSRDRKEAMDIFRFIGRGVDNYLNEAKKEGVRIIHLGRKDRIPASLRKKLIKAEEDTKNNTRFVCNIAIDYGGHDEIVRVTQRIIRDRLDPETVDEYTFASYLDTGDQPYPYVDLLIRTSGEERTSGFLPWQMNYAEVWWEESLLPDFTREKFVEALLDYSRRRRRFGRNDEVRKFNFKPHLVARFELDWWRARKFHDKKEFARAFVNYAKEQFGISLTFATRAAKFFVRAALLGDSGEFGKAKKTMTSFYRLLRQNIKLAFEPSIVADLSLEYLRKTNGERRLVEAHDTVQELYAELFRIPLLQAEKVADLRLIAQDQAEKADAAVGNARREFRARAEEYLTRSYEVLKERVA